MTRILVVDDSPLMRRVLADTFRKAGDFVVEVARDGLEAIARLHAFRPDVITLDIHMPGMDGLACLDRIMLERPTPVVMVSALTAEGADETLEAMALGAVDFLEKPGGPVSLAIEVLAPELVERVRTAAGATISKTRRLAERVRLRTATRAPLHPAAVAAATAARPRPRRAARAETTAAGVVLVGCSTGGPPALEALLTPLPANFPWPIVVAQHMPRTFTGPLARRLDRLCALAVEEVVRSAPLIPGHAYIGAGDADLLIGKRAAGLVAIAAPSSPDYHWHPSVDRLVASATKMCAPENLIGVLMTGMGTDGADAMSALHGLGGSTIAEAEETAVVWGMPGALVRAGGATIVSPLDSIATDLIALVGRG